MPTYEPRSVSLKNAKPEMHNRITICKGAIDTVGAALVTFAPGSSWLKDSQEFRGTHSCPLPHVGFMISGSMGVRMDDGTVKTVAEGEMFLLPPGHDAWSKNDAPCTFVEFTQGSDYFKDLVASYEPSYLDKSKA